MERIHGWEIKMLMDGNNNGPDSPAQAMTRPEPDWALKTKHELTRC